MSRMIKPFDIVVDFKQKTKFREPVVTQFDDIVFTVSVLDDNKPIDLTGSYKLVTKRSDNKSFYVDGVTTGDSKIQFELGKAEVEKIGKATAVVQLIDESTERISSFPFSFMVVEDISLAQQPTTGEKTLLEIVIEEGPGLIEYFNEKKPLLEQIENDQIEIREEMTNNHNKFSALLAQTTQEVDSLHLIKAGYSDIEEVQNEIANIVSNNGDGTKDTELINARTDINGKSETSLKSRLDKSQYKNMLSGGSIAGTRQTVIFNEDGSVQKVQHYNNINALIRNDVFTYQENKIIEERVIQGEKKTCIYDLETLETIELNQTPTDDLLVYTPTTWSEWIKNKATVEGESIVIDGVYTNFSYTSDDYKENTVYGILLEVEENSLNYNFGLLSNFTGQYEQYVNPNFIGNVKYITTTTSKPTRITFGTNTSETGRIKIKDIRLFELPNLTQIKHDFENISADELYIKYPKELN